MVRHIPAQGGCIVLVSGEAGTGKSSLLQAFARRQRPTRVLWGGCDALFTPRPLGPLHDIARQSAGTLLETLNAGSSRDAIFNALLDELDSDAPTLLVFEDMHWADEASLDLLKFLGRRIAGGNAMLAISYRDDEVGPRHPLRFVIGDLPRASTRRLPLAALSESAVTQLALQTGRSARDLYDITGGNAFFVTEVLASVAGAVPASVRDAVLARALHLSPAARDLAELVAVVPGKAESWLLAPPPADATLDSCLDIGMLRDPEGALSFRHELARRAFEESMSQSRRQALHAGVLKLLAARADMPSARLAHHADGARDVAGVLRYGPAAAEHARALGAHREAAAYYQLTLRYADGLGGTERAHLCEQLAYECYLTDQIELAIEARLAALEVWRATGATLKEGDTLRWLSRLSWFAGRGAAAVEYATAAVATLATQPPDVELAMAYSNRAQLDMLAHATDAAILWASRAIELSEKLDARDILSHALNNLGTARLTAGDLDGVADLERSLEIALAGGFQEHVARAYTNLASRCW